MKINELQNKIDIVEVVQKYVKLKKVGKYYAGLCPFHSETKPSFYVSPERQIFKCFGCGEGGNVITFLMKIENLSFKEVLEKLREDYGLEIDKEIKPTFSSKILEINYVALKFFKQKLKDYSEAKNYLLQRGLTEKTLNDFELGYSPGGTSLRDYLYAQGYSLEEIKSAGLLDDNNFDRFQQRIIFPLRNERGELVGFTGRIFPEKEKAPKYLNTPETEVFKKSDFLYGLFYAKDFIFSSKEVLIVEGQMDFLLSFQNGIKNIVAVSGSALTEAHLRKIKKYTNNLVLAFDNDEAGFRASLRANLLAQKMGFEVYRLIYPEKDLGDFFKNQREIGELKRVPFLDYLLEELDKKYGLVNKKDYLDIFLPQLQQLSLAQKDKYLEILAKKLNLPKELLFEELKKADSFPQEIEEEPFLWPTSNFEKNLSLKILSLFYSFELNVGEDFYPYLTEEVKLLYQKLKANKLSAEEIDEFEMRKRFFEETKINPEKEFQKTLKELKKVYYKKMIEKLREELKFSDQENYDKIIEEINLYLQELRKIEKNG